jgi:hypothetical protein
MAYTTIDKASSYINAKLHTGNGSTQSITGVGFQPDLTWIKDRSGGNDHQLVDAVRGATKAVSSNRNDSATHTDGLTSFDSDGYTLGSNTRYNGSSTNYVGWNWKANGSGSANSDGTITTTATSANTTSGFSIVSYTGNGTSGATVGHGLGAVPTWILVKRTDTTGSWQLYSAQSGSDKYAILNSTGAFSTGTNRWNDTDPTSSVFSLGNSTEVNANGGTYIAYVQANKPGYFQYGLYQGNGNADGRFVYTGGRPKFILIRPNINTKAWVIYDDKRDGINGGSTFTYANKILYPNAETQESTIGTYQFDILSNGFKIRETNNLLNGNGNSYNYWVWMQSAVGSNNVPCTAR